MKEIEKFAVNEFVKFGKAINPVNYYSHPFDFGRSILLRISGFPDPNNTELREKIGKKFNEMYDVALKKYGAVPIRPIGSKRAGTYMEVLRSIKKALDPNNILNRDSGLFEQGEL
jgi:FAD/FMN-containing dehydrogenase